MGSRARVVGWLSKHLHVPASQPMSCCCGYPWTLSPILGLLCGAGHHPTGQATPLLPQWQCQQELRGHDKPLLPLQAGCGKPQCLGQCLWVQMGSATPPCCTMYSLGALVQGSCTGPKWGLRGRALLMGTLWGVTAGRAGTGSSWVAHALVQVEPAPRSCVYQGYSATWHIPGESLFSGLQELPLLQPPPTPHTRNVPSFIWQHCPAQFAT